MARLSGATLVMVMIASLVACKKPASAPTDALVKLDTPAPLAVPEGSYLDLGRAYLKIGDMRLANLAFVRSMRVEGLTAEALSGAGLAAERQGLLYEARRYFERARNRAPDSALAHNNLGAVLYKLGEFNEAKQAFQAAFRLSGRTSTVASQNLELSELALRRVQGREIPLAPNPLPLQREGTGEYRLLTEPVEPDPVEPEQEDRGEKNDKPDQASDGWRLGAGPH